MSLSNINSFHSCYACLEPLNKDKITYLTMCGYNVCHCAINVYKNQEKKHSIFMKVKDALFNSSCNLEEKRICNFCNRIHPLYIVPFPHISEKLETFLSNLSRAPFPHFYLNKVLNLIKENNSISLEDLYALIYRLNSITVDHGGLLQGHTGFYAYNSITGIRIIEENIFEKYICNEATQDYWIERRERILLQNLLGDNFVYDDPTTWRASRNFAISFFKGRTLNSITAMSFEIGKGSLVQFHKNLVPIDSWMYQPFYPLFQSHIYNIFSDQGNVEYYKYFVKKQPFFSEECWPKLQDLPSPIENGRLILDENIPPSIRRMQTMQTYLSQVADAYQGEDLSWKYVLMNLSLTCEEYQYYLLNFHGVKTKVIHDQLTDDHTTTFDPEKAFLYFLTTLPEKFKEEIYLQNWKVELPDKYQGDHFFTAPRVVSQMFLMRVCFLKKWVTNNFYTQEYSELLVEEFISILDHFAVRLFNCGLSNVDILRRNRRSYLEEIDKMTRINGDLSKFLSKIPSITNTLKLPVELFYYRLPNWFVKRVTFSNSASYMRCYDRTRYDEVHTFDFHKMTVYSKSQFSIERFYYEPAVREINFSYLSTGEDLGIKEQILTLILIRISIYRGEIGSPLQQILPTNNITYLHKTKQLKELQEYEKRVQRQANILNKLQVITTLISEKGATATAEIIQKFHDLQECICQHVEFKEQQPLTLEVPNFLEERSTTDTETEPTTEVSIETTQTHSQPRSFKILDTKIPFFLISVNVILSIIFIMKSIQKSCLFVRSSDTSFKIIHIAKM